jgi:tetratricopeptide (TPR) repeat protein
MEQENFEIAQLHFSRSLQIFRETGDRISQGQSLRYMGVLYFRRRYFGSSLKYYQESLRIAQEGLELDPHDSDKQRLLHQQAEIHNLLGNLYFKLWNINACRRELVAGLQGFRTLQKLYVSPTPSSYLYYQPVLLLNLGRIAMLRRQYGKAQHYFDRCHRICKRINRSDTEAGVLFRMAELARTQGKIEKAFELAKQAEELSDKELPPLRNRAAALRSQMRGDRRQQIQAVLHQIKIIVTLIIDLVINAPLVLLKSIGCYLLFLTGKLAFKLKLKQKSGFKEQRNGERT